MKTRLMVWATVFGLAFAGVAVQAATRSIEGTVSGYTCVVLGKACPVDREDPVIAAEKVFVVVRPDGTYVLVPNLDRAILARHLTEKVRITGMLDEKYNAVHANTLEIYLADSRRAPNPDPTRVSPLISKDGWKTVWSLAMEAEARKMLEGGR
jgi:hypothetical protein